MKIGTRLALYITSCVGVLLLLLGLAGGVDAVPNPNGWATVTLHQQQQRHSLHPRRHSIDKEIDVPNVNGLTSHLPSSTLPLVETLRGGGCADSDPSLFAKLAISALLEALVMLGTLVGSVALSDKYPDSIPSVFNLPLTQLVAAFLIIFASSFFGSFIDGGLSAATNQVLAPDVIPGDSQWYSQLKKPWWNPPGYVFPIMWLLISKPTQLCGLSRILKYGTSKIDGTTSLPLGVLFVYCSHLALGDTWNKVFFGLQCPGRGAAVITLFFACLLSSAYLFYDLDEVAGYYFLPTCGWVAVATALQWYIYLNNKPDPKKKK